MGLRSDESIRICEGWQVGNAAFCHITLDTCFVLSATAKRRMGFETNDVTCRTKCLLRGPRNKLHTVIVKALFKFNSRRFTQLWLDCKPAEKKFNSLYSKEYTEWMKCKCCIIIIINEWKCEDFKCVWKPTESRLCLTHYVNKSSRWAK